MTNWLTILLLLITSAIQAADVVITGPDSPIDPRESAELFITGLTDAELRRATVQSVPSKGVELKPRRSWDSDDPIIAFKAALAGQYTITVAFNGTHAAWRDSLEDTLGLVGKAQVDAKLLNDLKAASQKLVTAYPVKSASCTVVVRSPVVVVPPVPPAPTPPPKPTPNPVVPVTQGIVYTVIIRTPSTLTADQAQVLSDLRQWSDAQPADRVTHFEFPPDAEDENGNLDPKVQSFVRQIPSGHHDPYVFIAQRNASGKSVILDHFDFPTNAFVIISKVSAFVNPRTPLIPTQRPYLPEQRP